MIRSGVLCLTKSRGLSGIIAAVIHFRIGHDIGDSRWASPASKALGPHEDWLNSSVLIYASAGRIERHCVIHSLLAFREELSEIEK